MCEEEFCCQLCPLQVSRERERETDRKREDPAHIRWDKNFLHTHTEMSPTPIVGLDPVLSLLREKFCPYTSPLSLEGSREKKK